MICRMRWILFISFTIIFKIVLLFFPLFLEDVCFAVRTRWLQDSRIT